MSEVEVYVESEAPRLVGRLYSHRRGRTESSTFAYDPAWIGTAGAFALEPQLPLMTGSFQTGAGRSLFGCFADSAPDRWGRNLLRRREALRADAAGETPRALSEFDYLVGVADDVRQGDLRLRRPEGTGFLAEQETGVPALVDLPVLLGASDRLDADAAEYEDLVLLFRAGSSLGGARPKAHVLDGDGHLSIAKFPSPARDEWDVIAWEAVAMRLAQEAGLRVPRFELRRIDGRSVLLTRRFDRDGGRRIGFISAMTMLERTDGDTGSYLEIASAIEECSPSPTADLAELWTRIALSVLISNTDDHLRNHGFLRAGSQGWAVSPLFDVNPNPEPGNDVLATAIDEGRPDADIGLLMDVAPYFRLSETDATARLGRVMTSAKGWRTVAGRYGLGSVEIERMSPAFEHDRRRAALEVAHIDM